MPVVFRTSFLLLSTADSVPICFIWIMKTLCTKLFILLGQHQRYNFNVLGNSRTKLLLTKRLILVAKPACHRISTGSQTSEKIDAEKKRSSSKSRLKGLFSKLNKSRSIEGTSTGESIVDVGVKVRGDTWFTAVMVGIFELQVFRYLRKKKLRF